MSVNPATALQTLRHHLSQRHPRDHGQGARLDEPAWAEANAALTALESRGRVFCDSCDRWRLCRGQV